jgi:hypothetical protein
MITRRQALKVAGSSLTAGALTQTGAASAIDRVKIPTLISTTRDGDEVAETKTVPKAWYEQHRLAKTVNEELQGELLGHPSVRSIGIGRSADTYGGKRGFDVVVAVSEHGSKSDVPDAIDGVNVRTETQSERTLACYNDGDYNQIPGGVTIGGDGGSGTSCCRVYYDGKYYIMTNAHLFVNDDDLCSSPDTVEWGDDAYQNGRDLGYLREQDHDLDMALVDHGKQPDWSFENYIAEPDGSKYVVDGYVSESGVADMISSGKEISKVGVTTGQKRGEILQKDVGNESCAGFHSDGVKTAQNSYHGDSGGPGYYFDDSTGYAYMIYLYNSGSGTASTTTPCGDDYEWEYSYGAAAYEISYWYDLVWGG